ncbi:MAG: TRAP transporter large permease subunit, partial [candidate division WOR-3 bacterium]
SILVVGAMVLNVFLAMSGLPQNLAKLLNYMGSPMMGVLLILALYVPLGMVMDATGMILLTLPLYMPFLVSNRVDLIWFGVLTILMVEIGLITPPVGMNVYVVQGVIRVVPMPTIFRGMLPFLIADVVVLIILILVPALSVYLPSAMR